MHMVRGQAKVESATEGEGRFSQRVKIGLLRTLYYIAPPPYAPPPINAILKVDHITNEINRF